MKSVGLVVAADFTTPMKDFGGDKCKKLLEAVLAKSKCRQGGARGGDLIIRVLPGVAPGNSTQPSHHDIIP